ncbi:MAG: hypothetical protein ACI915_001545 [Gammaproteobacteria bacterium]|jgi:hypothetical protein
MFYRNVVALSRERHKDWSVDMGRGYQFTSSTNSIYVAGTEFPMASREYPIVFAKDSLGTLVPVALLGVVQNQNLMLAEDGSWLGTYIPAYIRRYPFILADADGKATSFAVCVDESFSGFNTVGEGTRLITENGEHGEVLANSVKFLEEFHKHSAVTTEFCKAVAAADLVESMQADFSMKSGSQFSLSGLYCVPRNKVKSMPAEQLKMFAERDYLDLLYLHIYSLSNMDKLISRYEVVTTAQPNSAARKGA